MIEQHLAAEGAADGHAELLSESPEIGDRLFIPARATDDEHRALRLIQHLSERLDLRRARVAFHRRVGSGFRRFDDIAQHVFRQGEHHRAGTTGRGDREGAGYKFRDTACIVNLANPFGEFGEGAAIFHFLKGFAFTRVALNLPDEQDHRN